MFQDSAISIRSKTINRPKIIRLNNQNDALFEEVDLINYYKKEKNQIAIMESINDVINRKKIKYFSFDVFDTVLLREQKSELERFFEISFDFVKNLERAEIQSEVLPFDALFARLFAMRSVYNISFNEKRDRVENFKKIARITCSLLSNNVDISEYIENEIVYEKKSLYLNPVVTKIILEYPNIRPIFISDMYLSGKQIHRILSSFLHVDESQIFSSGDETGSKRVGSIYPYLETLLEIDGHNILHLGDNLNSDFIKSREAGWNAVYLPVPVYEKKRRWQSHQRIETIISNMNINMGKYIYFNY